MSVLCILLGLSETLMNDMGYLEKIRYTGTTARGYVTRCDWVQVKSRKRSGGERILYHTSQCAFSAVHTQYGI